MSSKPEPIIWSLGVGQQKPCCDRCQLTITWSTFGVCFGVCCTVVIHHQDRDTENFSPGGEGGREGGKLFAQKA